MLPARRKARIMWINLLLIAGLVCGLNAGVRTVAAGSDTEDSSCPVVAVDSKLSPELSLASDLDPNEIIRVIVQTDPGADAESSTTRLKEKVAAGGGRLGTELPLISGHAAEIPRRLLSDLADDETTRYITLDRQTSLMQAQYDRNLLQVTTGASNVAGSNQINGEPADHNQAVRTYLQSLPPGPNGSRVTIAVLDSGIYDSDSLHQDLRSITDPNKPRILTHLNFVSNESVSPGQVGQGYDPYGHGTHVAGIAAGSGRESITQPVGNLYSGMAFNANLVDLRVIGSRGSGYISDTISAIGWMVQNRWRYNIRVANFSIGAAVTQSYKSDPLCQAAEQAVRAGIVCVCAAGNFGKDSAGKTVYGSIQAPGNDPMVTTVGATDTWGTARRSDDTIASYSSRGPTLVDFSVKPDLVAPGTLIRSIAANQNYLTTTYNLDVYASRGEDVYMWLSGTSMAAPVVSGAAALMLDANSSLTPAMVKSILQFTAQPLPSLSTMDPLLAMLNQGAGCLNVDGAVRMAEAFSPSSWEKAGMLGGDGDDNGLLIDDQGKLNALLYSTQDAGSKAFTSIIAGERVLWGAAVVYSEGIAYMFDRTGKLSAIPVSGFQVARGFTVTNGFLLADSYLLADGFLMADGHLLADGFLLADAMLIADVAISPQATIMTNGWLIADTSLLTNPSAVQVAWAANLMNQGTMTSGILLADQTIGESVMVGGDAAAGFDIVRITSRRDRLYPHGQKIVRH
jgi:serine protease AprX